VAQWINARSQRSVTNDGGWIYLRRLTFCLQLPRPQHAEADLQEQMDYKKTPEYGTPDTIRASGEAGGIMGF
jgi:hypothetical protein